MNNLMNDVIESVRESFLASGLDLSPENALKAIEFARQKMKAGEISAEAFLKAREIILVSVPTPSDLLN